MRKRLGKNPRGKAEEEEVEKSPRTSTSIHSVSIEEVEEVPTNKKRRDKEKVLEKGKMTQGRRNGILMQTKPKPKLRQRKRLQ
jgi:hypothetical protein